MSFVGKNPKFTSVTFDGFADFATADATTKREGRLVYVQDTNTYYVDDGAALTALSKEPDDDTTGVDAIDTLANLTALGRSEGKIYYATDTDSLYIDDGASLLAISKEPDSTGVDAIDTLANLTALGRSEGKVYYATDQDALYIDDGTSLIAVSNEPDAVGVDAVDTLANLTALGRVEGKIYYATDTDKLYTDDGSALNVVGAGAGAGDADTIHLIQAEDLLIGDIDLTGQAADFDGGGTITASSLSLSTTAADLIKGSAVIKYDPNANGQNDYFGFTKSIPRGLRGREIGFGFEYKTDSTAANADFRFAVKQKDGALAGNIEYFDLNAFNNADGNSLKYGTSTFIASDCTEVELGWQNTSTTTTVEFYATNILVSSDPFILKELATRQSIVHSAAGSTLTTRTTIEFNVSNLTSSGDDILSFANSASSTVFTANRDCTVNADLYGQLTNSGESLRVRVNGTDVQNGGDAHAASAIDQVSASLDLLAGDEVTFFASGSGITNGAAAVYLTITAEADHQHAVSPATTVNPSRASSTNTTNLGTGVATFIDFDTVDFDIDGRFIGEGSGLVTTTKTGFYWEADNKGTVNVQAAIAMENQSVWAAGEWIRLAVYKNGAEEKRLDYFELSGSPGSAYVPQLTGAALVEVLPGDYLEIAVTQSSGASISLSGFLVDNFVSVNYTGSVSFLGAVPTIAAQDEGSDLTQVTRKLNFVGAGVTATESGGTVSVTIPGAGASIEPIIYRQDSGGQSIPNSTITIVNFDDQEYDPSGLVTTGASWNWECPVGGDGVYMVMAHVGLNPASGWAVGENFSLFVYKNGSKTVSTPATREPVDGTGTISRHRFVQGLVQVVAGDTIDVRVQQTNGSAISVLTTASEGLNHINIFKVN